MTPRAAPPEVQLVARVRALNVPQDVIAIVVRLATKVAEVRILEGDAAAAEWLRAGAKTLALGIQNGLHGASHLVAVHAGGRQVLNQLVHLFFAAAGEDGSDVSHQVLVDRQGAGRVEVTSTAQVSLEGACFPVEISTAAGPDDVQRIARDALDKSHDVRNPTDHHERGDRS
jgi:hypothetical protein